MRAVRAVRQRSGVKAVIGGAESNRLRRATPIPTAYRHSARRQDSTRQAATAGTAGCGHCQPGQQGMLQKKRKVPLLAGADGEGRAIAMGGAAPAQASPSIPAYPSPRRRKPRRPEPARRTPEGLTPRRGATAQPRGGSGPGAGPPAEGALAGPLKLNRYGPSVEGARLAEW